MDYSSDGIKRKLIEWNKKVLPLEQSTIQGILVSQDQIEFGPTFQI